MSLHVKHEMMKWNAERWRRRSAYPRPPRQTRPDAEGAGRPGSRGYRARHRHHICTIRRRGQVRPGNGDADVWGPGAVEDGRPSQSRKRQTWNAHHQSDQANVSNVVNFRHRDFCNTMSLFGSDRQALRHHHGRVIAHAMRYSNQDLRKPSLYVSTHINFCFYADKICLSPRIVLKI